MFELVRIWLSRQETADALDPVIFFLPRLVDSSWATAYGMGALPQQVADEWLTPVKIALGAALALGVLLLVAYVVLRKQHHWWPLVLLLAIWSTAGIAGPIWGQSLIICAPDYVDNAPVPVSVPALPSKP